MLVALTESGSQERTAYVPALLEMPQNAEHIKWTTEGAVKGGVQSRLSILRRYASVNCRDM